MFGPMGNPYAKNMTKEEVKSIWRKVGRGRRTMYRVARHFPSLLPGFLKRSLIGKPVKIMRSVKRDAPPKVCETRTSRNSIHGCVFVALYVVSEIKVYLCGLQLSFLNGVIGLWGRIWHCLSKTISARRGRDHCGRQCVLEMPSHMQKIMVSSAVTGDSS